MLCLEAGPFSRGLVELIVHSISYTQACMEDMVHVEIEIKRKTASECRICGIGGLLNETACHGVCLWLPAVAAAASALRCIAGHQVRTWPLLSEFPSDRGAACRIRLSIR